MRVGRGLARARPGRAGVLALLGHCRVEAVTVDRDAARLERVLGQVERKAVRVVELERGLARELLTLAKARRGFVEELEAARERDAETLLFQLQRLDDERLGTLELGIGLAHLDRKSTRLNSSHS